MEKFKSRVLEVREKTVVLEVLIDEEETKVVAQPRVFKRPLFDHLDLSIGKFLVLSFKDNPVGLESINETDEDFTSIFEKEILYFDGVKLIKK